MADKTSQGSGALGPRHSIGLISEERKGGGMSNARNTGRGKTIFPATKGHQQIISIVNSPPSKYTGTAIKKNLP